MAAAVFSALAAAARNKAVPDARLSLAHTAELLAGMDKSAEGPEITGPSDSDYAQEIESSSWGPGRRLAAPLSLGKARMHWDLPATRCNSAPACWPE